uniref:Uncharacterized protein n=1 Tax=Avena sativa TaxID=4498 RepID=A0ACD5UWQ7_AVESA
MDLHGGGGRRIKLSSTGGCEEDRLSSLPDDLLRRILRGLPSTADAAQTSLLSRRWVRLWVGIPEIWFPGPAIPGRVHAALAAYAAHDGAPIHGIHVTTLTAPAESTAAWLRLAAPRLSGELSVVDNAPLDDDAAETLGVIELPCFENATKIELRLGCPGIALPDSGVFAKLETLFLEYVRFHGPCELGEAVSSARCPSLRRLTVRSSQGVSSLAISSQSLVKVSLGCLKGLQQLMAVAPMVEHFHLSPWYRKAKLSTVNISAPRLEKLTWAGRFEPSFLQRAHLQELCTAFKVYGRDRSLNPHYLSLFRHFEAISLQLLLVYPANSVNSYEYLMDDITFLPDVKNLVLSFCSRAHAFGASAFHLLRLCAGIRGLKLKFLRYKEPPECPSGCTCDQQNGWKSEGIFLNRLGEAEIHGIKGVEHEVVFLEQLFRWATALEKMTITFDPLVAVSDNLCEEIASFSRPETCVEVYLYRNGRKVLFAPVI